MISYICIQFSSILLAALFPTSPENSGLRLRVSPVIAIDGEMVAYKVAILNASDSTIHINLDTNPQLYRRVQNAKIADSKFVRITSDSRLLSGVPQGGIPVETAVIPRFGQIVKLLLVDKTLGRGLENRDTLKLTWIVSRQDSGDKEIVLEVRFQALIFPQNSTYRKTALKTAMEYLAQNSSPVSVAEELGSWFIEADNIDYLPALMAISDYKISDYCRTLVHESISRLVTKFPDGIPIMIDHLSGHRPVGYHVITWWSKKVVPAPAKKDIAPLLSAHDPWVRAMAALYFSDIQKPVRIERVLSILEDGYPVIGSEKCLQVLEQFNDPAYRTRAAAYQSLILMGEYIERSVRTYAEKPSSLESQVWLTKAVHSFDNDSNYSSKAIRALASGPPEYTFILDCISTRFPKTSFGIRAGESYRALQGLNTKGK
jgi:hypothetical protein